MVLSAPTDRGQRALGTALGGIRGAVGLHDDDRQRVGHDVVHLAGDGRALLLGGELQLLFALALDPLGAVPQVGEALEAGALEVAERPRRERGRRRRRRR